MSVVTLIEELSLMRVFDILSLPNIAFMIIILAVSACGLAGTDHALRLLTAPHTLLSFGVGRS
jgi:hypothetical protein